MTPPKSVDAAARAYYDAVKATGRVSIYELVDRAGVDRKTVIRHMAKGYLRGERMVIGGKDTWTFSEPETLRYCDVAPMLVEQGRHTGGSSPPETPTGYMTIEELAATFKGRVKVGKLDTDANRTVSVKYGIQAIPTVLVFKDGEIQDKKIGLVKKGEFESVLTRLVG